MKTARRGGNERLEERSSHLSVSQGDNYFYLQLHISRCVRYADAVSIGHSGRIVFESTLISKYRCVYKLSKSKKLINKIQKNLFS